MKLIVMNRARKKRTKRRDNLKFQMELTRRRTEDDSNRKMCWWSRGRLLAEWILVKM